MLLLILYSKRVNMSRFGYEKHPCFSLHGVFILISADASLFTKQCLVITSCAHFEPQSGWTSCLGSLVRMVVSPDSVSLRLTLSVSVSVRFITPRSITEELLVCAKPRGSGPAPSSQSLPSVLPKNTELIKAGDWSMSAWLWERRGHRN